MKRLLLLSIILAVVCVSCSFSEAENINNPTDSKSLVKVCFQSIKTKSLTSAYDSDLSIKYYLTAEPLFTRSDRATIVGETTSEPLVSAGDGKYTAGYFEQGNWKFILDAYLEDDSDPATEGRIKTKIASQTIEKVNISQVNNTVVFNLDDIDTTGKGSLSISVKVPKLAEEGASFKVYVDGATTAESVEFTESDADGSGSGDSDLIQFEGSIDELESGNHILKFEYYIQDEEGEDVLICSDVITVRIIAGIDTEISGDMLNGKYVENSFAVILNSDKWSIAVTSENSSVQSKTNEVFTCKVTGAGDEDKVSYLWYVDGVAIGKASTAAHVLQSTHTFTSEAPGIYCITCVVKIGNTAKCKSIYIEVITSEE